MISSTRPLGNAIKLCGNSGPQTARMGLSPDQPKTQWAVTPLLRKRRSPWSSARKRLGRRQKAKKPPVFRLLFRGSRSLTLTSIGLRSAAQKAAHARHKTRPRQIAWGCKKRHKPLECKGLCHSIRLSAIPCTLAHYPLGESNPCSRTENRTKSFFATPYAIKTCVAKSLLCNGLKWQRVCRVCPLIRAEWVDNGTFTVNSQRGFLSCKFLKTKVSIVQFLECGSPHNRGGYFVSVTGWL